MVQVLIGTHQYEWALEPFAKLFEKYWGDEEIIFYSDHITKIPPLNVEFRRVPCYTEGIWPWRFWFGEGLRSICADLESKDCHIIALFLLDHWLNKPVNKRVALILRQYMERYPEVIRANLTEDQSWNEVEVQELETFNGLKIVCAPPWSIHCGFNGGFTFCPSLWRVDLLKEIVQSHWTLTECENLGTQHVIKYYPSIRVVGSEPAALSRVHGLHHGQPNKIDVTGLNEEDKEIVLSSLPSGYSQ